MYRFSLDEFVTFGAKGNGEVGLMLGTTRLDVVAAFHRYLVRRRVPSADKGKDFERFPTVQLWVEK